MKSDQEKGFVKQLKAGDPKAFARLVRENQDVVFGYLYRMLNSRHEAEEVAQEVFIAAFRFMESFRGEGSLRTWLLRIASNMYKNKIRYNVRRRRAWETGFDDLIERPSHRPIGQRPDGPEQIAQRNELEVALGKAIEALPEEFREVLVLRDIELHSYADIQIMTDLPQGTIKSRLHRARSHLAKLLGDQLEGEELKQ